VVSTAKNRDNNSYCSEFDKMPGVGFEPTVFIRLGAGAAVLWIFRVFDSTYFEP